MTAAKTRKGASARRRFRRPSKLTVGLFVAVVAVAVLIAFLDLEEAWRTLRTGDLRWVLVAVVCSALSYVFLAFSFGWIFTRMGVSVPMRTMAFVGYTSASLNHLMPMPAVTGHGIRVALLRDRGISPGGSLAASTFHMYVSSFVLVSFLPIGMMVWVLTADLPGAAKVPMVFVTTFAIVLLAAMTWLVFHGALRRRVVSALGGLLGRFIRKEDVVQNITDFDDTIEQGVRLLKRRKGTFAVAVLLDLGDWTFTALTLLACFHAFGVAPNIGVLLTGFVVGIVVGLQSIVPGGLGLQEASMAGLFALMGLPFAAVVLTALLFRVVYHFLPFAGGLLGYARLMQRPFHFDEMRRWQEEVGRD